MDDFDFSALLCSRLCHDLISPVGAIANGIEILAVEDDEYMRVEVMKLLEQSAGQTSDRLKFFRLAFGAAGGFGENIPLRDAENAIVSLYQNTPVEFEWNSQIHEMNKSAVKVMLNMLLMAGESLVRGGDLTVDITDQPEHVDVAVTVQGERVILQDRVRDALCGALEHDQVEAKTAPAFLAFKEAHKLNSEIIYLKHDEQSFTFHFSHKK